MNYFFANIKNNLNFAELNHTKNMFLQHYQIDFGTSLYTFEFVSQGPKGDITKIVQFTQVAKDLYFLGFGDKDDLTETVNDLVISDNKDSEKVLATVANIVYLFSDENPKVWVYAKDSTPSRTRLYQIGISRHLEFITTYFKILGMKNGSWKPFTKGDNYSAFLIKKR